MSFELKHFSPEALAKLTALNPNLYKDLGIETNPDQSEADFQEALKLNTETWATLGKAYAEQAEAYRAYLKAKKGKPLYEPGQILAALLFFCLLLVLI